MPDIEITDSLNNPVGIHIDLAHPSSLLKYLRSELLHLLVFPDFIERKDLPLSKAAPKPVRFKVSAMHAFQLGGTQPEIDFTPAGQATIGVNATAASNLFEDDAFPIPSVVPDQKAYASVGFEGSLDLGISGTAGDLSFGVDKTATISMRFLKAFDLGRQEPTLADAVGHTFSSFVIPADVSDLQLLGIGDIATVSGKGQLGVTASVSAAVTPNPLASVDLPLTSTKLTIKAGATAALSASLTLAGEYQLRVRRLDSETIELSLLRERGQSFSAEISASAGVKAKLGDTDLAKLVFGAIGKDPAGDKDQLSDLRPDELATLSSAIKDGLNHSLQASMNLLLSSQGQQDTLLQYHIQPAKLNADGALAIRKALRGDFSLLTGFESEAQAGGLLAPGITLLNSLLTRLRERGLTLHLNLVGLLNFASVSDLVRQGEVLTDKVSGDVTIKEVVSASQISAISEPLKKSEALRKVLFDSITATTCYRAGRVVSLPELQCSQVHFALNQNTNHQVFRDYLRWFSALHLFAEPDTNALLERFNDGGASTCVLRTSFEEADCDALFFDKTGQPRSLDFFLNVGRLAMRALLDPEGANDVLRSQIVSDALWGRSVAIGANVNLGPLVGLSTGDPRVEYLIGDVLVITQWANAMQKAAGLVHEIRALVGSLDPATVAGNEQFKSKRDQLQKALASMARASKARFDEPWGMVSLFWAGDSQASTYGKAVTQAVTLERGAVKNTLESS